MGNIVVAQGSLGMLSPNPLAVVSDKPLSKSDVPPEDMNDYRELANSAAYYSTQAGVFTLNGKCYSAAIEAAPNVPECEQVRVTPISAEKFASMAPVNR